MSRWSVLAATFLLPLQAVPASAPPGRDAMAAVAADQLVLECSLTMRYLASGRVQFVDYDDWDIVVDFGRQTLQRPGSSAVFALTATTAAYSGLYVAGPDRRTLEIDRLTGVLHYSAASLTDNRTGYGTCAPAPASVVAANAEN